MHSQPPTVFQFLPIKRKWSLKDIGSSIIDQISSDIYTTPGQILREVVKNAYDAYQIDGTHYDESARTIVISRRRDRDGTGHLLVADSGQGQSQEALRRNVQISISHKPSELTDATGFRGLGSWAMFGAGSKIVITSKEANDSTINRLTINVKAIYSKIGRETTLDDIMNDETCILIEKGQDDELRSEHYTEVDIQCDGKAQRVNGFEINRLYPFTDPNDTELKRLILEHCPVPIKTSNKAVNKVISKSRYSVTTIALDGLALLRTLPDDLEIVANTIKIGGKISAYSWYGFREDKGGALALATESNLFAGIQLKKYNVPIGHTNLYASGEQAGGLAQTVPNQLNWYVGEVHIVDEGIGPSANGAELRAGAKRERFLEGLREFYQDLSRESRDRSNRNSALKHFSKIVETNGDESRQNEFSKSLALADKYLRDKQLLKELASEGAATAKLVKDVVQIAAATAKAAATGGATRPKKSTAKPKRPATAAPSQPPHKYVGPIVPALKSVALSRTDYDAVLAIANRIGIALTDLDNLGLQAEDQAAVSAVLGGMFETP